MIELAALIPAIISGGSAAAGIAAEITSLLAGRQLNELTEEELATYHELLQRQLEAQREEASTNAGLINDFMTQRWGQIKNLQTNQLFESARGAYQGLRTQLGLDPETAGLSLASQYGEGIRQVREQQSYDVGNKELAIAMSGQAYGGSTRTARETLSGRYDRAVGNLETELAAKSTQAMRDLIALAGSDLTLDQYGGSYGLAYQNMLRDFADFEKTAWMQLGVYNNSLGLFDEALQSLNEGSPFAPPPQENTPAATTGGYFEELYSSWGDLWNATFNAGSAPAGTAGEYFQNLGTAWNNYWNSLWGIE